MSQTQPTKPIVKLLSPQAQKEYDERENQLATEEEKKAHEAFQAFCESHSVKYQVYQDFRRVSGREVPINEGIIFVSERRIKNE